MPGRQPVTQVTVAGVAAGAVTDLDGRPLATERRDGSLLVTLGRPATAEQPGVVRLSGASALPLVG